MTCQSSIEHDRLFKCGQKTNVIVEKFDAINISNQQQLFIGSGGTYVLVAYLNGIKTMYDMAQEVLFLNGKHLQNFSRICTHLISSMLKNLEKKTPRLIEKIVLEITQKTIVDGQQLLNRVLIKRQANSLQLMALLKIILNGRNKSAALDRHFDIELFVDLSQI